MAQRTLVLIKPDGVERGLAGEILARFERRGLELRGAKLVLVDADLAGEHYGEHREKPFFGELVEFITSSPTLALVLEGESAIEAVRTTMGATNPVGAAPGTVRGDLALAMPNNLVHGSDSPESAAREIALWFSDARAGLSGSDTTSGSRPVEPLVLASTSPRRREILGQLRVPFDLAVPAYDEIDVPGRPPREQLLAHARGEGQVGRLRASRAQRSRRRHRRRARRHAVREAQGTLRTPHAFSVA